MLLRGINFAPPALDRADIEATRGRANRSGRSHGGAPLRGDFGNNRGRGGHNNFADPRPNPFAAHISPDFTPQVMQGNYRGGPPPPLMGGWPGPLPGAGPDVFWRGPPPHQNPHGNPPHSYAPPSHNFNYGRPPPPPPPPPQGYQNGHHDGNYGNRFSNSNQYGPPPDGRHGGHDDRIGR